MSIRKTFFEKNKIKEYLENNFNAKILSLKLLKSGELSCPYSFISGDIDYIIRIDREIKSYKKDKYAWENFASKHIPIPQILMIGKFDDKHYCSISRKAVGTIFDKLSLKNKHLANNSLISILHKIHKIDISDTKNFGYLDENGQAEYTSWKDYLLSINDGIDEWKKIYLNAHTTEDIFERIYDKILQYIKFCPENRYLIHGDYGYNNVTIDDDKVTAVLDWGESRYGDFAYDIAWLDFWQDQINYEKLFKSFYEEKGIKTPNLKERILSYKLNIGYGSICFFVESEQFEHSDWVSNKMIELISS